jgi:large subunit ribosomal protein L13
MKTYVPKQGDVQAQWYIIDAAGQNLGRLASDIATVLRGKHKASYTPNDDVGDHVIVVNAGKVAYTGKKREDKMYYRHSGYPGGLTEQTMGKVLETHPERVLEKAVRGMLPHNRLGEAMYRKLKVYAGDDHRHEAQHPRQLGEAFGKNRKTGLDYEKSEA